MNAAGSTPQGRRGRGRLYAGGVLIALAFGYLAYSGFGEGVVYFLTPEELLAKGETVYDAPVRLGGQVVAGTVDWDKDRLFLSFRLTGGSEQVAVVQRGAPPQMFREGIGVVVEGKMSRAGVFEATNLMVKHSNEYRSPGPGERPEDLYRTLLEEGEGGGARIAPEVGR